MLIHATRMWIATKVVDLIQQFAESIFSERILGCEQPVVLEANSKRYVLPNKLREIGPQALTIRDVTAKVEAAKIPLVYLDESVCVWDSILVDGCNVTTARCMVLGYQSTDPRCTKSSIRRRSMTMVFK